MGGWVGGWISHGWVGGWVDGSWMDAWIARTSLGPFGSRSAEGGGGGAGGGTAGPAWPLTRRGCGCSRRGAASTGGGGGGGGRAGSGPRAAFQAWATTTTASSGAEAAAGTGGPGGGEGSIGSERLRPGLAQVGRGGGGEHEVRGCTNGHAMGSAGVHQWSLPLLLQQAEAGGAEGGQGQP